MRQGLQLRMHLGHVPRSFFDLASLLGYLLRRAVRGGADLFEHPCQRLVLLVEPAELDACDSNLSGSAPSDCTVSSSFERRLLSWDRTSCCSSQCNLPAAAFPRATS